MTDTKRRPCTSDPLSQPEIQRLLSPSVEARLRLGPGGLLYLSVPWNAHGGIPLGTVYAELVLEGERPADPPQSLASLPPMGELEFWQLVDRVNLMVKMQRPGALGPRVMHVPTRSSDL